MGGFDSYCFICGAQAQVASTILHSFKISAKKGTIPPIDSEKVQRFLLDKKDRVFLQDLVSIGPYNADDEPIIDDQQIYRGALDADESEAARLAAIEPETICMIEGLVPGSCHDLGGLERPSGEGFNINAAVYPFGHALCFRLLTGFAPRLMQPVGKFWATVRAVNGTNYTRTIDGVDYGDVTGSQEQFVWPFHMYGGQYDGDSEDEDEGSHGGCGNGEGSDNGNEVRRDVDSGTEQNDADDADNADNGDDDNEEVDGNHDDADVENDEDGEDDEDEGNNHEDDEDEGTNHDDDDNEDADANIDGVDENGDANSDEQDEAKDWEDENLPKAIKTALNKEPLDLVDLRDYWSKTGCMYVWVRPDKFPVREAFQEPLELISCDERTKPSANHLADLPIDVLFIIAHNLSLDAYLSLLGLCTSLRAKLISCADTIARQRLTWAAPCAVGEQERWDALQKEVKAPSQFFPWLSYARQCYLSPSMRNRQRIWGICQQLEGLALSHGVL